MITRPLTRALLICMLVGGALASCSKEQQQEIVDDTAEIAARNAASSAGGLAFERAGIEVSDALDCTANSTGGAEELDITCTGSSNDGAELMLEGTVSAGEEIKVDEVRGSFVGTVDGEEVFSEDCIGDGC